MSTSDSGDRGVSARDVIGGAVVTGNDNDVVVNNYFLAAAPSLSRGREYLAAFLDEGHLFGHTHDLVGRDTEVEWLIGQINEPAVRFVILPGRGGSGKSRLLLELDDRLTDAGIPVWWLSPATTFTPTVLAELQVGRAALVLDDAHRRSDMEELARLLGRRPDVTVVASARPEGVHALSAATRRAGHDDESVRIAGALGALSREAARALGEAAAGRLDDNVRELADDAAEFPLLITVGGHLIRREDTASWALKADDRFRKPILARWQDEAVAQVGGNASPELTLRTLACLAALTPYDDSDKATRTALAAFLGIHGDELVLLLGKIEAAGLLERRGPWLRVVPDVLAGEFLRRWAVSDVDQPTGFIDRLVAALPGQVVTILRDAGEMDLFLRSRNPDHSLPLTQIWAGVLQQVRAAGAVGRLKWVTDLAGVALYQPEPVLRLVRDLLEDPAEPQTEAGLFGRTIGQDDIIGAMGALLRPIGSHLDHVPAVCRLLWQIGKDDTRDRNRTTDHPLRVFTDIAGYLPGKWAVFQQSVLDTVVTMLDAGERAGKAGVSPLALLAPITAKDGMTTRSDGDSLAIRPFTVSPDNIQPLRERVRGLALRYLFSEDLSLAHDAVILLEAFLRDPLGGFGHEVTDEERQVWRPEQTVTHRELQDAVERTPLHPAVALRVRRAVSWHARDGHSDMRSAAQQTWRYLTDRYALDLQAAVSGGGHLDDDLDVDVRDRPERDRRQAARQERLVDTLLARGPADILTELEQMGIALRAAGNSVNDLGMVLGQVCERDTAKAQFLGQLLLLAPEPHTTPWLATVLAALASTAPAHAAALGNAALDTRMPSKAIATALAWSTSGWNWDDTALREVFDRLLAHPDPVVRTRAVCRLHFVKHDHPGEVVALALGVDMEDQGVAAAVAEVLTNSSAPGHILTRDADVDRLLTMWEPLPGFDDYQIPEMLRRLGHTHPERVATFFLHRAARAAQTQPGDGSLEVIPLQWALDTRTGDPARRGDALRRIRDEDANKIRVQDRAMIFAAIAGEFDDTAMTVLRELLATPTEHSVQRAVDLLGGASRTSIFDQQPFIIELLDAAASLGKDVGERVQRLLASTTSGSLPPTAFADSSIMDAQIHDRAQQLARTLPSGTARSFYDLVASQARARIGEEQRRQQFLRDLRTWT